MPHSSLTRLPREHQRTAPRFKRTRTLNLLLAWAGAWKERTVRYPSAMSGRISEVPGLTWAALDQGLRYDGYGLRMGSSLSRLIQERRGKKRYEQSGQEKR